jgi:hypothetical protein
LWFTLNETKEAYVGTAQKATVFFKKAKKQKMQRLTTGVKTPWLAPLYAPVKSKGGGLWWRCGAMGLG